ncbi:9096_t:CDS:1, partial [Ambispora leptoticha]
STTTSNYTQPDIITPLRQTNINTSTTNQQTSINTTPATSGNGNAWHYPSPTFRMGIGGGRNNNNHQGEINDLLSYIDAIQLSKEPTPRKKKALEAIYTKLHNLQFEVDRYFQEKIRKREIDPELIPHQVEFRNPI